MRYRIFRALMHLWFYLARGMTMGVRAVVADSAGRVFLVRHSYVPGWHLPGGGIEIGETARDALAKELREEGNIVVIGEARLIGLYLNRAASRRDHVALYLVEAFEQHGPRLPDYEIVESGFFARNALPELTSAATRRRLEEVFDGAPQAQIW